MKNKYILSAAALATIATPIATVISCGNGSSNNSSSTEDGSGLRGDVLLSTNPKKITTENSTKNFKDLQRTTADTNNKNEILERKKSGQPFALHFHAADLPAWDPANDPDAAFNKSTVPLKDRKLAAKYMENQTDKELTILAGLNKQTSRNKIGTLDKDDKSDNIFTMWSHISKIIGWGGSSSEGNWVIPKGDDINAAHRNGVPILGTVFMAPNQFGGTVKQYEDMVVKEGNTFPVADSMIKMSKYYGFDGWFLNFETTGVDEALKSKIGEFIKYLYDGLHKDKQFTILYDYGIGFNYYEDGNFDKAAIDFHHRETYNGNGKLELGKNYKIPGEDKKSIGYNYDIGVLKSHDEGGVFDYSKHTAEDLWIYSYFRRNDIVTDGDEADLKFFTDSEGARDPRSKGTDAWTEMSKYFQDRTVINSRDIFTTSFEQGFGTDFYINGEKESVGNKLQNGYRNIGLQDILPTYTYINDYYDQANQLVSIPGEAIKVDDKTWKTGIVDNEATYYGSSTMMYQGKLESKHRIENKLYASNLTLKKNDEFTTIIRDLGDATPQMAIWTQDNDENDLTFDKTLINAEANPEDLGNGYNKYTFKISDNLNEKEMKSFGLAFTNKADDTKEFNIKLSNITFTPKEMLGNETRQNKITKVNQDGNFLFQQKRNVRINWDMQNPEEVDHYRIYSADKNFNKINLMTITALPAAFLEDVEKATKINLVIEAVDVQNRTISSSKVEVKTDFIKMNDASKWSTKFVRKTEDSETAKYVFKTSNGYTFEYKDADGAIYIGDDYTRIHKIDKDGFFHTNKSDDWGKQLLGSEGKDTKILSIINWDENNIAAITSKGTVHIIDKVTGKQSDTLDKNILNKFLAGSNFDVANPYTKLSSVSIAGISGSKLSIVLAKDKSTKPILLEVDINTKIVSEKTSTEGVTINKITETKDGKFIIAYQTNEVNGNKKTNLVLKEKLDLSNLNSSDVIQSKLDEFVSSDAFKNSFSDKTNADVTDFLAKGDIIDVQETEKGFIALNSWGITFTLDDKMNVTNVSSVINSKDWGKLTNFMANYDYTNDPAWMDPTHGIATKDTVADNKMSTFKHIWENLFRLRQGSDLNLIQKVKFDSDSNQYIISLINGWSRGWWGHWNFRADVTVSDLTNFISGNQTKFIDHEKNISLSTEESKKIDDVRFFDYVNGVYIFGGSTGKFALFNDEFEQIQVGEMQYIYDGDVMQTLDRIYDTSNHEIPSELME